MRNAGIFQCFPAGLEQQALLWINTLSFTGGNAKKQRIKLIDPLLQKSPLFDIHFSGLILISIIKTPQIPTFRRNIYNGITSRNQQIPEALGIMRSSWEAAANPDQCNRFVSL